MTTSDKVTATIQAALDDAEREGIITPNKLIDFTVAREWMLAAIVTVFATVGVATIVVELGTLLVIVEAEPCPTMDTSGIEQAAIDLGWARASLYLAEHGHVDAGHALVEAVPIGSERIPCECTSGGWYHGDPHGLLRHRLLL